MVRWIPASRLLMLKALTRPAAPLESRNPMIRHTPGSRQRYNESILHKPCQKKGDKWFKSSQNVVFSGSNGFRLTQKCSENRDPRVQKYIDENSMWKNTCHPQGSPYFCTNKYTLSFAPLILYHCLVEAPTDPNLVKLWNLKSYWIPSRKMYRHESHQWIAPILNIYTEV